MFLMSLSVLGGLWGCVSAGGGLGHFLVQGRKEVVFLQGRPRQADSTAGW